MGKSKKVEKETRALIEGITDVVRTKDFKIKSKNKNKVKKIKKACVHWIYRNGKETPTVEHDPDRDGYWRCKICGQSFPIAPMDKDEYSRQVDKLLEELNQLQFWSVQLGGDAEDTRMFMQLRALLPKYKKAANNIIKAVNKREELENKRKHTDDRGPLNYYDVH